MRNRYLYLVFLALSVVVMLLLALTFKLAGTTDTMIVNSLQNLEDSQNVNTLDNIDDISDSWISKISAEKNQKEYLYPVQKFSIEFNIK